MHLHIITLTSLALLANASPIPGTQRHSTTLHPYHPPSSHHHPIRDLLITPGQLIAIAPTSTTCDNPPAPGECATAFHAAPRINEAFFTYAVFSPAEQAALISLMAFETLDFKYNRNHFPGVPGQGTRNMQSPAFNKQYALSIPEIRGKVSDDVAANLDLLLSNERWDFGSAAWFLVSQCTEDQRRDLQSGSEQGWEAYISGCVGTTVTDARREYWTRAIEVLDVNS
ncbi:hypothetical protein BGW36DRAFT_401942 [Talaromyces proteolyticus]|uniref:Uncharacterized protein n=1 Tax=Talaromyces proteolyticus TaxID=1131652 RepID=A0AAD4KE11_9EURO|nr:uncharacterized protein BGW36DRAFT_401942 [Talaromyces proteolyticus]KAH8689614.1 hypothetical protein BGW36DRAFT_401942 [Talaromyces proteolyticus]